MSGENSRRADLTQAERLAEDAARTEAADEARIIDEIAEGPTPEAAAAAATQRDLEILMEQTNLILQVNERLRALPGMTRPSRTGSNVHIDRDRWIPATTSVNRQIEARNSEQRQILNYGDVDIRHNVINTHPEYNHPASRQPARAYIQQEPNQLELVNINDGAIANEIINVAEAAPVQRRPLLSITEHLPGRSPTPVESSPVVPTPVESTQAESTLVVPTPVESTPVVYTHPASIQPEPYQLELVNTNTMADEIVNVEEEAPVEIRPVLQITDYLPDRRPANKENLEIIFAKFPGLFKSNRAERVTLTEQERLDNISNNFPKDYNKMKKDGFFRKEIISNNEYEDIDTDAYTKMVDEIKGLYRKPLAEEVSNSIKVEEISNSIKAEEVSNSIKAEEVSNSIKVEEISEDSIIVYSDLLNS
jgi:hypothetical protein